MAQQIESILPSELQGEQAEQVEEGATDCVSDLVLDVFINQVKAQLAAALLPQAKQITQGMMRMESDARDVTERSTSELQAVEAEQARLAGLVSSFQQHMAHILGTMQ